MGRFLFPIILVALAVIAFVTYINPTYTSVKTLQLQYADYDQALKNAAELKSRMQTLAGARADINPQDLNRLETLLPDSVNNVRLVLDLTELGKPKGIIVNNVVFEPDAKETTTDNQAQTPQQIAQQKKDYGTFNISFSITGSYQNFVAFLGQLDQSLRLIDVSSIAFTATNDKSAYRYDFKVKTYWLK